MGSSSSGLQAKIHQSCFHSTFWKTTVTRNFWKSWSAWIGCRDLRIVLIGLVFPSVLIGCRSGRLFLIGLPIWRGGLIGLPILGGGLIGSACLVGGVATGAVPLKKINNLIVVFIYIYVFLSNFLLLIFAF